MADAVENPPAFPLAVPSAFQFAHDGMSLRDWFAGQALSGWLASEGDMPLDAERVVAIECYRFADAMLLARETRNG